MQATIYFYLGILLSIVFFSLPVLSNAQTININTISTSSIVYLTNSDRTNSGLIGLKSNPKLEKAAQMKAEDMVRDGYFSHIAKDGKNPWYWIKEAGYRFKYAGENLAVLFDSANDIEKAWLNSPSHRENILNSKFTEIGVGIATGTYKGVETHYVVEIFGAN